MWRAGWGRRNYVDGIPFNAFFLAHQVVLKVNMNPLKSTAAFPYLGMKVTYNNSDRAALYNNLRKAEQRWDMVAKVLRQTGEHIK